MRDLHEMSVQIVSLLIIQVTGAADQFISKADIWHFLTISISYTVIGLQNKIKENIYYLSSSN